MPIMGLCVKCATKQKQHNARHHPPAHKCDTRKLSMRGTLIRVGCMPLLGGTLIRKRLHSIKHALPPILRNSNIFFQVIKGNNIDEICSFAAAL